MPGRLNRAPGFVKVRAMATNPPITRPMTEAQRDYERKRAEKAGLSLDKWLQQKQAPEAAAKPAKPARPPGLLSRLIDRAHQPLKKP